MLTVDGTTYNVNVTELKRSAAVLDGENAGRTKAGVMVRDIIGTYYNYTLTIEAPNGDLADYDSLYQVLSAPVNSHWVDVPFGQGLLTFSAYVSNVDDSLRFKRGYNNGPARWGEMSVTFTAMQPQRTP